MSKNAMRDVTYTSHELDSHERWTKKPAKFHQFGVSYELEEYGVGSYSTAIIEFPDGSIKNVPVSCITFEDPS